MNIETVKDWLRNFAEDYRNMQLSHQAYKHLWQMIESMDHELENTVKTGGK